MNGGYALAGRDCYCIQNVFLLYDEEELWETEVNYTECLVPCVGHGSQYCGNEDHVLLYEESEYQCSVDWYQQCYLWFIFNFYIYVMV